MPNALACASKDLDAIRIYRGYERSKAAFRMVKAAELSEILHLMEMHYEPGWNPEA